MDRYNMIRMNIAAAEKTAAEFNILLAYENLTAPIYDEIATFQMHEETVADISDAADRRQDRILAKLEASRAAQTAI